MTNILYIDIYFFLNFTVNYVILLLVEGLLKTGVNKWRICVSSLLLACTSIVVLKINNMSVILEFVINYIILTSLLIFLGLKIKNIRVFIKAYISLFLATIFLGGILLMFEPFLAVGSLFFFLLTCTYFIVNGLLTFLSYQLKDSADIYKVTIYVGDDKFNVNALYDTGNKLKDPDSGGGVSIIGSSTSHIILDKLRGDIRNIPYHTISGTGVIPIVSIDKMCIHQGGEKKWVLKPWIGLLLRNVTTDDKYEMILNSEII